MHAEVLNYDNRDLGEKVRQISSYLDSRTEPLNSGGCQGGATT